MTAMRIVAAGGLLLAVALTGCSTPAKPAAAPTPASTGASPSAAASPSDAPVAAPAPTGSAVTTLDPCQLVTQQEASTLSGVALGSGKHDDVPGGERRCNYSAGIGTEVTVAVVQAASVAEAQAEKDKVRAEAEQQLGGQVNLARVSGLGDDAESLQASLAGAGGTVNMNGIYVLKGRTGFAIVGARLGGAAPNSAALIAQANTVLGRLG